MAICNMQVQFGQCLHVDEGRQISLERIVCLTGIRLQQSFREHLVAFTMTQCDVHDVKLGLCHFARACIPHIHAWMSMAAPLQ